MQARPHPANPASPCTPLPSKPARYAYTRLARNQELERNELEHKQKGHKGEDAGAVGVEGGPQRTLGSHSDRAAWGTEIGARVCGQGRSARLWECYATLSFVGDWCCCPTARHKLALAVAGPNQMPRCAHNEKAGRHAIPPNACCVSDGVTAAAAAPYLWSLLQARLMAQGCCASADWQPQGTPDGGHAAGASLASCCASQRQKEGAGEGGVPGPCLKLAPKLLAQQRDQHIRKVAHLQAGSGHGGQAGTAMSSAGLTGLFLTACCARRQSQRLQPDHAGCCN